MKSNNLRKVARRKFDALMIRDKSTCQYCKSPVFRYRNIRDIAFFIEGFNACIPINGVLQMVKLATIDHIIRLEDGGNNSKDNLVVSCYRCNRIKG